MKTNLRFLMAATVLFGACSIDHTIGSLEQERSGNQTGKTSCGGFAGRACPSGQLCVDDPSDTCDPNNGGADCLGVCVADDTTKDAGSVIRCPGFSFAPTCPNGTHCADDPNDMCTPGVDPDCGGICVPDQVDAGQYTTCGGFGGFPCPTGETCIDDPRDSCDPNNGGADCGGICVPATKPVDAGSGPKTCGGLASIPCGMGEVCVDDPNDNCDPNNGGADCGGICVPDTKPDGGVGSFCGGFANFACPGKLICVDDPRDMCDPANGGADCGGVCVEDTAQQCAGFANLPCPTGYACVDDPRDMCDPAQGNADCGGFCVTR